jgi:hypothetical protein
LENRREREARDREDRGGQEEQRLKVLEERIEDKVSGKKVRKVGKRIEKDRKDREEETRGLSERKTRIQKETGGTAGGTSYDGAYKGNGEEDGGSNGADENTELGYWKRV